MASDPVEGFLVMMGALQHTRYEGSRHCQRVSRPIFVLKSIALYTCSQATSAAGLSRERVRQATSAAVVGALVVAIQWQVASAAGLGLSYCSADTAVQAFVYFSAFCYILVFHLVVQPRSL